MGSSIVKHQKLVRDRIPEIIESNGHIVSSRTMLPAEYQTALFEKFVEEIKELLGASPENRLDELADINEVLLSLASYYGYSADELQNATVNKRLQRGGFKNRVWLESTAS